MLTGETCTTENARSMDNLQASDCNDQNQSILFRFPPEIKNQIYKIVLSSEGEKGLFLSPNLGQSRALLRTCRRAWAEAHAMEVQNSTLSFKNRESLERVNSMRASDRLSILHLLLLDPIERIDGIRYTHALPQVQPKHITLRRAMDTRRWLRGRDQLFENMNEICYRYQPFLETFVLELEVGIIFVGFIREAFGMQS
jgi:hypothetical protein